MLELKNPQEFWTYGIRTDLVYHMIFIFLLYYNVKAWFRSYIIFKIKSMSDLPQWFNKVIKTENLFRRDFYICTNCGGQSCGGIYASVCRQCNGIKSDPPHAARSEYLCNTCAHSPKRFVCKCDYPVVRRPSTPPLPKSPSPRPKPPHLCCCSCGWCNFLCRCMCCCLKCLCQSSSCGSCCVSQWNCHCCTCYWSWCRCSCVQLPEWLFFIYDLIILWFFEKFHANN